MPYEFQAEGMLQRLSAYLAHQDFCAPQPPPWPPESDVSFALGEAGASCKATCRAAGRICEPSYFPRLNSPAAMEQHGAAAGVSCSADNKVLRVEDIYFPAFNVDTGECVLQSQPLLFSCVGESIEFRRLCPCRTFIPGQTALCKNCL
jgi:alpha-1,3(6)-mannosylglycoprotein beta-1,6-N-acetyl-glucosaminyltransferase